MLIWFTCIFVLGSNSDAPTVCDAFITLTLFCTNFVRLTKILHRWTASSFIKTDKNNKYTTRKLRLEHISFSPLWWSNSAHCVTSLECLFTSLSAVFFQSFFLYWICRYVEDTSEDRWISHVHERAMKCTFAVHIK